MTAQRDIILLPYPFSDRKESKVRPAVIISSTAFNRNSSDIIAIPMTSNLEKRRRHDILITDRDLENGVLIVNSKIKTDKIFTVEKKLIKKTIGRINKNTHSAIQKNISKILG